MEAIHQNLIALGVMLLLGLLTSAIGRSIPLPQVTLLGIFGVLIGPAALDLLPIDVQAWYPLFSDVALLMVGFLLGGRLSRAALRKTGRQVVSISVFEVVGVSIAVFVGLRAVGVPLDLSLLLAGIAPASAPAAVSAVVQEVEAEGRFTDTLLGVVAIDDAWGLIMFSLLLAAALSISSDGGDALEILQRGGREIGGAVAVGCVVGLPAAYLTGRIRPGEPMQTEALGIVLLCGGLALWLEVSFLLAAMVMGAVVVNLARHHRRPFHEIRNIEWPFMVVFFVLAGASLHVDRLAEIGFIGAVYIGLRVLGLIAGGWLGGLVGNAEPLHRRWIGIGIMPQAGVALGMALVAGNRFPDIESTLLAIVIGTTVIFELIGPILTRLAVVRVGEAKASP